MHGSHSMPQVGIQQVSLKACRRWDSTCHRIMTVAWIDEPLDPLDSWYMRLSNQVPWTMDHVFGQFWELGFCWVRECQFISHRVQICKFLGRECVASIPTWILPKHAFMTHWKPFLMHGFHSMPQLGIQRVSLKAWDSTFHRLMTVAWIDEPLAILDSVHRDSARVALYSTSMDKGSFFLSIFETRDLLNKWMWNFLHIKVSLKAIVDLPLI